MKTISRSRDISNVTCDRNDVHPKKSEFSFGGEPSQTNEKSSVAQKSKENQHN